MRDYEQKLEEYMAHPKPLSTDLLLELIDRAKEVVMSEEQLLEVEARSTLFVGDTHGDVHSTVSALRGKGETKVFLGDYVDRGPFQLENIILLMLAKVSRPDRVFLLRGNHESIEMNEVYGFLDKVVATYGYEVYREFAELFSYLSVAAILNSEIFAVHGGVAVGLETLSQVRLIPKGHGSLSSPIAFQMLWNDPSEDVEEFAPSFRGPGVYVYGRRPVERFLERNGLRLIIRAHEPFPEGYREFFGGKLISIFSCRFYPITAPRALLLEEGRISIIAL